MGIYANFADNLRQACFRYPSIAAVCDGTGINRQQFNKYLSGKTLPGSKTLNRICSFLGVTEEAMFAAIPGMQAEPDKGTAPVSKYRFRHPVSSIISTVDTLTNGAVATGAIAIGPGLYSCYFPLEETSHHLMKSLVTIRRIDTGLVFNRLTVFPSQNRSTSFVAKSRHFGLVLANEREIFFAGMNRAHPEQLSFLSFERASGQFRDLYTGLSIIRTSQDAMAARACLCRLKNNESMKQAIQSIGPIHIHCETLNPIVRAAIFDTDLDRPNHLLSLTFAEAMVRALRESSILAQSTPRQTGRVEESPAARSVSSQ